MKSTHINSTLYISQLSIGEVTVAQRNSFKHNFRTAGSKSTEIVGRFGVPRADPHKMEVKRASNLTGGDDAGLSDSGPRYE